MYLINIVLWVHELVIIETGHIDARLNMKGIIVNIFTYYTISRR